MNTTAQTIRFYRRKLPHWEVADGRYFITLRLRGALPVESEKRLRDLLLQFNNIEPQNKLPLQRQIFRDMEHALDNSTLNCHLRNPQIAKIIQTAIKHRNDAGIWQTIEYVIMPNHLHLFVAAPNASFGKIIPSFKKHTAKQSLPFIGTNDGKGFWQREWFDHWSRSGMEDEKIINYIRNNPVKAGLVQHYTEWPHSSWAAPQ